MKSQCGPVLLALLLLLATGCGRPPEGPVPAAPAPAPSPEPPRAMRVRPAAVAGLFYPADTKELSGTIDRYLADAPTTPLENLRGLVCPHAGYRFSGPVAAYAYKQLQNRKYSAVVVMGPSHYADFAGAAVLDADAVATPLGEIRVSSQAAKLAQTPPLALRPACRVARPGWAFQSPIASGEEGVPTPHTWEHSLEVQFPFLERTLTDFSVVPIVFGRVDPAAVARVLEPSLGDDTLVIASSDLSHYHPYQRAKQSDAACVRAVCELDFGRIQEEDACGRGPILALMHLARSKGWKARLLDCRNSGDTAGDKSAVVGYAAIAFYSPGNQPPPALPKSAETRNRYTPQERALLLRLARQSLEAAAAEKSSPAVPDALSEQLREPRACFVTLTMDGDLRGCIGSLSPREALAEAVIRRAQSAACEDPRFPPVKLEEVPRVHIEISVLSPAQPLEFKSPDELLARLRPHLDGVVLVVGPRQATYLPQVWKQLPVKEQFLESLCQKAGLAPAAWKSPKARIETYQVESFEEPSR